jgi:hypothetical protein
MRALLATPCLRCLPCLPSCGSSGSGSDLDAGDTDTDSDTGDGIGSDGLTSDGPLLQYYPPCPHGPGAKSYHFTLYALSEAPTFAVPAEEINGQIVTDAIAGITLGSCVITVTYTDDSVDSGV